MEFWGAEVKVGESIKVDPTEFEACINLSQAALGEAKKEKPIIKQLQKEAPYIITMRLRKLALIH